MRRSDAGQAAADYAAVLLVVAVVLAAAGAGVAAVPGLGERVVATVRTGICIVGGDICRDADARAAGLEPCVVRQREEGTDTAVELVLLRVGEDGRWTVAVQSDDTAVVSRSDAVSVGATGGVGVPWKDLEIGLRAHVGAVFRSGRSWRFRNLAAAGRFLARARGADPAVVVRTPPDERWVSGGPGGEVAAGADLPWVGEAGVRTAVEHALGRRTAGGRATWYFATTIDAPHANLDLPGWSWGGASREALVGVTSDAEGPRELVVQMAGGGGERREELSARLDLREPAVRARLGGRAPWSPAAVRDLLPMAVTHGVVERQVHVVDDRSGSYSAGTKLGLALGLEHTRVDVRRRLADATVWIAGSGPRRRADCLGLP